MKRFLALLLVVLMALSLTACVASPAAQSDEYASMEPAAAAEAAAEATQDKTSISDIIRVPFGYLLDWLHAFCKNYGVALILFSLIVKLVLLPMGIKSKKSMLKMSRMSPLVKSLEAKYGDDKQKYQQEVNQLYKDEGVSMFGGCLWSLLPLLILFPLFVVIREPLHYLLHLSTEELDQIKQVVAAAQNVEVDKLNYYWQYAAAQNIEVYGKGIVEGVKNLNLTFLGIDLGQTPDWKVWTLAGWSQIGGFLMPLISGGLNYLSMFISQKMNNTVIRNEKGEADEAAAKSAQTGKTMTMLMPLMSVVFGFMYPLGLSIYWIAQSVFGIVQDYFLTKHYRKIYDAEDEVKRQKAAERAAEEAEKERIRAAKRAANPDGITENTSKKKQQLREKQEREAAAKRFEEKKLAEQGVLPEDSAASGGEANRPYARGRAYQADRYAKEDNEE